MVLGRHFGSRSQQQEADEKMDAELPQSPHRNASNLMFQTRSSIINVDMSMFDLQSSMDRAETRLKSAPSHGRRPRSDRGASRLDGRILRWLTSATSGHDRPNMTAVIADVTAQCRREGVKPPSRATAYKLLATLPTATFRQETLPASVRDALYNLTGDSVVPAHQVAFYCFNYGDLAAVSFAAGLPWLALYQAGRMSGYRARSRGLLEAVMRARGV